MQEKSAPTSFRLKTYQLLLRIYFSIRNSWPVWYGILNRDARAKQAEKPLALSTETARIVRELRSEGIATTTLDTLLPNNPLVKELLQWTSVHAPVEDTVGKKKFLREYWSLLPTLDFSNPFLRFAVCDDVLAIVNAYMNMWSRLSQYDLRQTIPVAGEPVQSQRWHRDPEEKRILKAFIYLSDVDEEAGPFTYVRKSTYGNHYGHLFPQRPPEGIYPPEEAVRRAIAKSDIAPMTGRAGTVIFCDTSGLHFGGRAKTKERAMFTAGYNSSAHAEGARYRFGPSTQEDLAKLSPQARFALSGKQIPQGRAPKH